MTPKIKAAKKRRPKRNTAIEAQVLGAVATLYKLCKAYNVNLVVLTDFGWDEFGTYFANGSQPDYMNGIMISIGEPEDPR